MNRRHMMLALSAAPSLLAAGDEKAVLDALEKWRTASLARDRKGLEAVIDPNCLYSHSNGRLETGAEQIEATLKGTPKYTALEVSQSTVREYGSTAIVRSNMAIKVDNNGAANSLKLNVLTVWAKQGGAWKMVARQSTRLPE